MKLISKIFTRFKTNSKALAFANYVIDDYKSLEIKINKLREIMFNLSQARRKNQADERIEYVNHINRLLNYIDSNLDTFIFDYADLKKFINYNQEAKFTNKTKEQINQALSTKNMIRKELEIIIKNFKNMSKKLDNIPTKEIIKRINEILLFEKSGKTRKRLTSIISYPCWR